jgi:hypothetical protein
VAEVVEHLLSKYKALSSKSSALKKKKEREIYSWALVAHTCNPSYSGGRDQEDHNLKPAQTNTSQDPILKKTSQKRARSGSRCTP